MQEQITMLPVDALVHAANVRFGLKKYRVESLKTDIINSGGIQSPITVNPPDAKGKHEVVFGNYRLAAAQLVDSESGGGFKVPCIVRETSTEPLERLKLQVAENVQRQDMTVMDIAVAARQMLDAGMSKTDVRAMFSRPGGRKGNQMKPLSNSMLNIYMSFLDFPKSIQNLIHEGILPSFAAKRLRDEPKDLWDKILEKAKADYAAADEAEDKEDEKFLNAEKRDQEKQAKLDEEKKKLEATKAELATQQKEAEEQSRLAQLKRDEAGKIYLSKAKLKDKDKVAEADKAVKALEAEAMVAERKQSDALKAAEKAQIALDKATAKAAEQAKKEAASAKPARISEAAVSQAAAAVTGSGLVALKGSDMREAIRQLTLPGVPAKTLAVGTIIFSCFNSEITPDQMLFELTYLLGERADKPKHMVAREEMAAKLKKQQEKEAAKAAKKAS